MKKAINTRLVEPSDLCPHRWSEDLEWPAREINQVVTTTGKTVVQFIIYNTKTGQFVLRNWNELYLKTYYSPTDRETLRDRVIALADANICNRKNFIRILYNITGNRRIMDLHISECPAILQKINEVFGDKNPTDHETPS